MTFDDVVSDLVRVIESVGAAIMVVGGLAAFVQYARHVRRGASAAYTELRRNVERVILLGLEVLIVGDIIRTIIVDPTLESVGVLGLIVVIRIMLSFSLEVEIDGMWPWNRWRLEPPDAATGPGTPPSE